MTTGSRAIFTYAPASITSWDVEAALDLALHICTRKNADNASQTAQRKRAAIVFRGMTVENKDSKSGDCIRQLVLKITAIANERST